MQALTRFFSFFPCVSHFFVVPLHANLCATQNPAKKIKNREEYKDLPVGPLPALIDVCPQILIYNPDDERKPR